MNKETKNGNDIINQLIREAALLEENEQWEKLISTCNKLLQYSANNLEALKQIALAHLNLGNEENVEKYCNIALSKLPTNSPERIPIERILQRINITTITEDKRTRIHDSTWILLLKPETGLGQTWVNKADIDKIEKQLAQKQKEFDVSRVNKICTNCWYDITHYRRYEIPSKGRLEILATKKVNNLLNIQTLRFVQEGAIAPEVYIRFEFSNSKIGALKINNNGETIGFHGKFNIVGSIIKALALTYYRDLVVPIYDDGYKTHKKRDTSSKGESDNIDKKNKSNRLPRHYIPQNETHDFREWHIAQHRARHSVVGHTRFISQGFQADWQKQEQARRAGLELRTGYTWVIEHERGGQEGTDLVLDGTDLSRRTRFLPPTRAETELDSLLVSFL
jgi:tetratricopeptide (TPR) repeat protein